MASLSERRQLEQRENFKNNSDPSKGISLVLPRVFSNISWRRIKKYFIDLNWGLVERVDMIPVRNYKRVFVFFAPGKWNTQNPEAMAVLDELKNGHRVKIIYDEPWYWNVSISSAKRPEGESKNNNAKKRRKERANAAQKRLNKTRKQNAGGKKKKRKAKRKTKRKNK